MDKLQEVSQTQTKIQNNNKCTEYSVLQLFKQKYSETIIYCTSWSEFLVYNGKYYKRTPKNELKQMLVALIEKEYPERVNRITNNFITSIYNLLKFSFDTIIEDVNLDHNYIAFRNCLYNTLIHKEDDFTPEIKCFKYIDVDTKDFLKKSDTLEKYLETTFKIEKEGKLIFDFDMVNLYQEMIGSLFSGVKESNRAFLLWGGGANGKSITTELILSLFPADFSASASLETLSQRFGRIRLAGKLLNICSEEESQFLKNDIFKALVTGESIDAERKNEDGISYHNFAKLIFATNNFPKFSGIDYSIKRRVIVIPFNVVFEGKDRDYNLLEKLKEELPQFVYFGLQGLKRLQENNYCYSVSEEAVLAQKELEIESSSAIRYIEEEIEIDQQKYKIVSSKAIYREYTSWARDNGHKPVSSRKFFIRLSSSEKLTNYKERTNKGWGYYIKPNINDDDDIII